MAELSHTDVRAARERAARGSTLPGMWQAAAMALLSGLACWVWMLPQPPADGQSALSGETSVLAEVAPDDIEAALGTLDGSSAFLAQWRQQTRNCAQKLAWVTVSRGKGDPPGTIRLQSGGYFSLAFTVTNTPLRIAIPYPAPYESGRGTLSVLTAGGAATVSLTPVWHIQPKPGAVVRTVTWRPTETCTRGNG